MQPGGGSWAPFSCDRAQATFQSRKELGEGGTVQAPRVQPCPPSNALAVHLGFCGRPAVGWSLGTASRWDPPAVLMRVAGATGFLTPSVRQDWFLHNLNIEKHQLLHDEEGQAHLETIQHHGVSFHEVSIADGPLGV